MADPYSTRDCATCGNPFPVKHGLGRKPIYCSAECRPSVKPTTGTKHGERVKKACAWCKAVMLLKPAVAKKRECCGKSCANHLKAYKAGQAYRKRAFVCAGCHKKVERTVKTKNDAGKFCSRDCSVLVAHHIKAEREALHRIGERQRSKEMRRKEKAEPEVRALSGIGKRIAERTRDCTRCGKRHVRRYAFSRFCSEHCRVEHTAKSKSAYKQTEGYRAYRRKSKSKRRALIRNAPRVDSIDPIEVFERDKWRCHLCGRSTPRRLRGTIKDNAPELEHIVSLTDGGMHTWSNVACSCRKCNLEKGAASFGQIGLDIA